MFFLMFAHGVIDFGEGDHRGKASSATMSYQGYAPPTRLIIIELTLIDRMLLNTLS